MSLFIKGSADPLRYSESILNHNDKTYYHYSFTKKGGLADRWIVRRVAAHARESEYLPFIQQG